jgi:menaquinone-dependent protoporphyrinogen IX oxidase/nitroimidazol reductase NimA-like FMN-containing flavoprotein (pyridoxamine 5'-phosphate oxidase superfamily)
MIKTLVLYSSKYGTTRDAARIIGLVTGPSRYCSVDEFKPEYKEFDFIIIGSPLYQEKLEPKLLKFLNENREWLKEKPVALFCTCLDKNGGLVKLTELQESLGIRAISLKAIGGRLIIEDLDETDHELIKEFLKTVKLPFEDMDFYNPEEVVKLALKLKSLKENLIVKLEKEDVKAAFEAFLKAHNTCTLATCHLNRVRSTPIEYTYMDGKIYLISEGGEKFANLIFNENVSIAVYDDYTGMNSLAGIQITGKATMLKEDSEEYNSILKLKGLNEKAIKSMPVNMNMVKIVMDKVEFLNSNFKRDGADPKQIYNY